ncbi:MAG: hypothetical protein KAI47_05895 [Deltaproteobacteria bacterium]|nr:hypothetical protein [Deltaproteobacteria bacterium]
MELDCPDRFIHTSRIHDKIKVSLLLITLNRTLTILLLVGIAGCRFDGSGVSSAFDAASSHGDAATLTFTDTHVLFADAAKDSASAKDGASTKDSANIKDDANIKDGANIVDLRIPPDSNAGRWYLANWENCPKFCGEKGLTNAKSPEGARCMSGEVRPPSGVAQGITFKYGCWPAGCPPQSAPLLSESDGKYCYLPGQKKDWNSTDKTVGCFCQ